MGERRGAGRAVGRGLRRGPGLECLVSRPPCRRALGGGLRQSRGRATQAVLLSYCVGPEDGGRRNMGPGRDQERSLAKGYCRLPSRNAGLQSHCGINSPQRCMFLLSLLRIYLYTARTVNIICLKIAVPPESGRRGLNTGMFGCIPGPSSRLTSCCHRQFGVLKDTPPHHAVAVTGHGGHSSPP